MDGENISCPRHLSSQTSAPTVLWVLTTPRSGPGSSQDVLWDPRLGGGVSRLPKTELNTEQRGVP